MICPRGSKRKCRGMIHRFNDGQRYCKACWKEKQSVLFQRKEVDGATESEQLSSTCLSAQTGPIKVQTRAHHCHTTAYPCVLNGFLIPRLQRKDDFVDEKYDMRPCVSKAPHGAFGETSLHRRDLWRSLMFADGMMTEVRGEHLHL